MSNFLTDLWYDLRAERLWPVAVVLLAALVATPIVLSKKAEEPKPVPATSAAPPAEPKGPEGPAQLAEVRLEEVAEASGSSLSSFKEPSNPFAPPRKVLERARRQAQGSSVGSTAVSGDTGTADAGGGGPAGNQLSVGGDINVGIPGGGVPSGGVSPDVGSGTTDPGGGPTDPGLDTPEPKTTEYTYVVDVAFRANDRERTVRGMEKLDMLPDVASPLLIFMGVTPKAGNAVFMVDSTLDAAGEGSCKPTPTECAYLYLGPGSEHEFTTDEGDSYMLRVDEIRRVKVGAHASASKASKNKTKTASAALARDRRSAPPLLADLVSVSSGRSDDSISDRDSR
jgi:hypothetical protein